VHVHGINTKRKKLPACIGCQKQSNKQQATSNKQQAETKERRKQIQVPTIPMQVPLDIS
jgi:hypothetical protein